MRNESVVQNTLKHANDNPLTVDATHSCGCVESSSNIECINRP